MGGFDSRERRRNARRWASAALVLLAVACREPASIDDAARLAIEPATPESPPWPSPWHIPPLEVSGWRAVELIQEHYPDTLRRTGGEEHVLYLVCVDAAGAITNIRMADEEREDPVDDVVVAAGREVLAGYRYLPAWRYVGTSETRVEPVAGCRRQILWFYEGQLEKSRHDETRLGLQFILDGRLVRVWDDGMFVPVVGPRAPMSQADASNALERLDPSRVVGMYKLDPSDIQARFGLTVVRPTFVLETR